jgi:hypothetical protein
VSSGEFSNLDQTFDQILSTFKFIPAVMGDQNILNIIQELTKPMVWTKPVSGILSDGQGTDVMGTLITSKVGSKEENKLAQYLVTDTPIVNKYGWKEDVIADGIGQSLVIYSKDGQLLIIRSQNGEYQILLSN